MGRARIGVAALAPACLLVYLLVGQYVRPGFTDYWGYMVSQLTLAVIFLAFIQGWIGGDGGLSSSTHVVVAAALAADTFGNTARWYAGSDEYDQLVHLITIAAIAAVLIDVLDALHRRGVLAWARSTRLVVAAAASSVLGVAWEGYEFVGDVVLHTGRSQGRVDTVLDIACGAIGAVTVAALRARRSPDRRAGLDAARSPLLHDAGEPRRQWVGLDDFAGSGPAEPAGD